MESQVNDKLYCVNQLSHIETLLNRPKHNLWLPMPEIRRIAANDFMVQKTVHPTKKKRNIEYVKFCGCNKDKYGIVIAITDKGASREQKINRQMREHMRGYIDDIRALAERYERNLGSLFSEADGEEKLVALILSERKYTDFPSIPKDDLYCVYHTVAMEEWEYFNIKVDYECLHCTELLLDTHTDNGFIC